ncbi:MAG: hypothetical protein FWJ74_10755 [Gemmatimonadota bacterium]|jgi:hypothetical protein
MKKVHTKEAAEAILRELPSVRGAFVREDVYGHPREIHVLVGPGPEPRLLARDIRDLLEERLGVPVDQRVISIAQLSENIDGLPIGGQGAAGDELAVATSPGAASPASPASLASSASAASPATTTSPVSSATAAPAAGPGATAKTEAAAPANPEAVRQAYRLVFDGLEATVRGGRIEIRVRVTWKGQVFEGRAEDLDGGNGRVRAVAAATLRAASEACAGKMHLELEAASVVRALGNDYVLVSVIAVSPLLGRKPVHLAGAHPYSTGDEAAVLAALHATNRVVALALRD